MFQRDATTSRLKIAGRICSNYWIERDGKVVLSEWRVALLEAVEETGSISAAAARQGVHFRVAWRKLQEMEHRLGAKLTTRSIGGKRGGGTQLTPEGRECVRRFRRMTEGLQEIVERRFQESFERG
jgi:molybdate transport system regulatory protein